MENVNHVCVLLHASAATANDDDAKMTVMITYRQRRPH